MGVKGLFKTITEQAPGSMEAVSESTPLTSGESLAIDTTYVIHRYIHADPRRRDLAGDLVRKFAGLVKSAPATTFVFDGPNSRAEKAGTRASRDLRRSTESTQLAAARAKLREGPPAEDAARLEQLVQTLERRCVDPTDEAIEGVRTRFEALGWNVQVAHHDGEELVAELVRSGQCDAGYTDDSDVLVWGCPVTYIRTGAARRMTRVRLSLVLEGLRFTHAQFVDMALLLGTDFTRDTLPGVGPKRALALIRQHGTIERVLEARARSVKCTTIEADFDYKSARVIFAC
jgi:flap endonuclease-1